MNPDLDQSSGPWEQLARAASEAEPRVMYALLGLGLLLALGGIALLVTTLARKRRALSFAAVLFVGATLCGGLTLAGRSAILAEQAALDTASREEADWARLAGQARVSQLVSWGLGSLLAPVFLGCALTGLGLSRLRRFGAL